MFAGIGIECTVGRARLGVWCQREAVEVGINPQILRQNSVAGWLSGLPNNIPEHANNDTELQSDEQDPCKRNARHSAFG